MRPQATEKQRTRQWGTAQSWLSVTALLLGGITLSGCHTDMWNQDKMKPFYQNNFYADQSADRPLVEHTVPVGDGAVKAEDPAYYTGLVNGKPIQTIPVKAVNAFASPKEMLLRGQERYNAYCSPCHGKTGDGNGFIMQRGLGYWQKLAASYHTKRLRKIQDGHIYDVLTNGYGVMYSYGARIQDPEDRWAIVAYIRALQLTRADQPPAPDPYGATAGASALSMTAPPPPVTAGESIPAPDQPVAIPPQGAPASAAVPSVGIPKPKTGLHPATIASPAPSTVSDAPAMPGATKP